FMILLPLLAAAALAQSTATGPTGPAAPSADRYDRCLALSTTNPAAAEAEAGQWALAGGDFLASQCLGMAYSREQRWS
ncbi:hypothetical protein, partial [Pseudomonas sp. MPR-R2A7]|uniref:hypothetical protein n=1 Tax=Pseudomonas sp. MPR-R2A7 TaxID=2070618 RepID=UPI001C493736